MKTHSLTLAKESNSGVFRQTVDEQAGRQLLAQLDRIWSDDAALAIMARRYMEVLIRQAADL